MKIEMDASIGKDKTGIVISDEGGVRFAGTVEQLAAHFAYALETVDHIYRMTNKLIRDNTYSLHRHERCCANCKHSFVHLGDRRCGLASLQPVADAGACDLWRPRDGQ